MRLRKITTEDKKLLFDWANDHSVRSNAIQGSEIIWEDHCKWFNRKMDSHTDTFIYILEVDTLPVGQVRFEKEDASYTIDYSVDKEQRGKGYGKALIDLGCLQVTKEIQYPITILANVKDINIASSKVFEKLGFTRFKSFSLNQESYHCWTWTNFKETCILVSEKKWNDSLLNNLQNKFPDIYFYHISEKKYLNSTVLSKLKPSKLFFPHWSYIIPKDIFLNFECIVFHMTDLPFGRGGSPLQNLIVRGIQTTKLSALRVVQELDAGPIYLKKELSLGGTAEEIFLRANKLIEESILQIVAEEIKPIDQSGTVVTFNRRKPADSNLNEIDNLDEMFDYIRMLDAEGYPNAFIETEHFRFEFNRASLKSDKTILSDVRIIKK